MSKKIQSNLLFPLFLLFLSDSFNALAAQSSNSQLYQHYKVTFDNPSITDKEKYQLGQEFTKSFSAISHPKIAALVYAKLMSLSVKINNLSDFSQWESQLSNLTLSEENKRVIDFLIALNHIELNWTKGLYSLVLAQGKELEAQISHLNIRNADNFFKETLIVSVKDEATLYNALGAAYFFLADYEPAQQYFLKAMKVFERINEPRGVFAAYNNLSLISWALHDYLRAVELTNQALAIITELEDEKNILLVTANLGRYQNALEDFDDALLTFEKVLNHKNISNYPKIKIGTLLSKAANLQHQNRFNESKTIIKTAQQLSNDTNDKVSLSNSQVALANLFKQQKKFQHAFKLYNSAFAQFESLGLKQEQLNVLKQISDLYLEQGNMAKAYDYLKQYDTQNIALLKNTQKSSILKLNEEFMLEQKNKRIKLLEQESQLKSINLKQTKNQEIFIVFASISLILIIYLSLSRRFSRKEAQQLIAHNKVIAANEKKLLLLSHAFSNTSDAVWIANTDFKIEAVNNAFVLQTHKTKHQVIGQPIAFACVEDQDEKLAERILQKAKLDGTWHGELYDSRSDGEIYPLALSVEAIENDQGEIIHYLGVSRDITEQKRNQEQLAKLATHDDLTKLPNRVLFEQLIQQACLNTQNSNQTSVLMLLDVNGFKKITDSFGHAIGDKIIQDIAKRLKALLYQKDVIARINGAEFGLLFELSDPQRNASRIAQKVLAIFEQAFDVNNTPFNISASIGITFIPNDGKNAQELFRKTAIALLDVKGSEQLAYRFYESHMNNEVIKQLEQEQAILHAISHQEFCFYYQPVVNIKTGKVTGAEALIRWKRADGSMTSPNNFIPLAEQAGFIDKIDQLTIDLVFKQVAQWQQKQITFGTIAINLSASIFTQSEKLLTVLENKINEYGISTESIKIELTESMLLENVDAAINTMNKLKALGFKLALDDFGTGFSSLNYLKRFPIDILKIDRSFVMDMHESKTDQNIVGSLISLAHTLNLSVIAEGIETIQHLEILEEMNCEEYQGYYYSKPLAVTDYQAIETRCFA